MLNQIAQPEPFAYLTPSGEQVYVEPHLEYWDGTSFVICSFRIKLESTHEQFEIRMKIPVHSTNIDFASQVTKSSLQDYVKDYIMTENWRIPLLNNPLDWKDEEIVDTDKLKARGFRVSDRSLFYDRKIEVLAKENEISRWLVLERLYKSDSTQMTVRPTQFNFPPNSIAKAIEVLRDLEFIEITHREHVYNGAYTVRMRATGMRFYEEHVLRTHNMVFVIAPCKEKWFTKSVKKMLEDKELKYIIQEETEHRPETIRDDILANIRACRFVIADISGRGIKECERYNPNCVYELGYAHALKKKIICSVNKDLVPPSGLPFDFAGVRFSFWSSSANRNPFAKEIKKRIHEVLDQIQRESLP